MVADKAGQRVRVDERRSSRLWRSRLGAPILTVVSQHSGLDATPPRVPDYGLTVTPTEDDHGHPLFVVRDANGICETADDVASLSPMARITWAVQQGLSAAEVLRMPFYHPVIEEALQEALFELAGKVEQPLDDLFQFERLAPPQPEPWAGATLS